jgi:hypothetical protein
MLPELFPLLNVFSSASEDLAFSRFQKIVRNAFSDWRRGLFDWEYLSHCHSLKKFGQGN